MNDENTPAETLTPQRWRIADLRLRLAQHGAGEPVRTLEFKRVRHLSAVVGSVESVPDAEAS